MEEVALRNIAATDIGSIFPVFEGLSDSKDSGFGMFEDTVLYALCREAGPPMIAALS